MKSDTGPEKLFIVFFNPNTFDKHSGKSNEKVFLSKMLCHKMLFPHNKITNIS